MDGWISLNELEGQQPSQMTNTYDGTYLKALEDAGAALRDSVRILVDDCSHGGGFETEMRDVLEASKLCLWCTRS